MQNELTLLDWLSAFLDMLSSPGVSVDIRRSDNRRLEATLTSQMEISTTVTGLRHFALLAINDEDQPLELSKIQDFFVERSKLFGTLQLFLVSSTQPDLKIREFLSKNRALSVTIPGNNHPEPDARTLENFGPLLLGKLRIKEVVDSINSQIDNARSTDANPDRLVVGAYLMLVQLFLSEVDLLTTLLPGRAQVMKAQSGATSSLSTGYAVQTEILNDGEHNIFLPDYLHIHSGLSTAATGLSLMRQLKKSRELPEEHEVLLETFGQFVKYYIRWLDGENHSLDTEQLRSKFSMIQAPPYSNLLIRNLVEMPPADQINHFNIMRMMLAEGIESNLLEILPRLTPRSQESCLKTLATLGGTKNLEPLRPYINAPRESLRVAAFRVIAEARGDAVAKMLIDLINKGVVPLSIDTLSSVARTRSVVALMGLLKLCVDEIENDRATDPLICIVESCLETLTPRDISRAIEHFLTDLEEYSKKMYESEILSAQRVAIKIVASFKLVDRSDIIANSMNHESTLLRLVAINSVRRFPADNLIEKVVHLLERPPEEKWEDQFIAWWRASTMAEQWPPIRRLADLDTRRAAYDVLREIDAATAEEFRKEIEAKEDSEAEVAENSDLGMITRSLHRKHLVFNCSSDLKIWVQLHSLEKNDDDMAMAALVHNNQFDSTLGIDEAMSMLSGGVTMAQGTAKEILEDVVFRCLRGESPKLPTPVGMGQTITTKIEDGKTVVTSIDGEKTFDRETE